jgi:hypothetical protein
MEKMYFSPSKGHLAPSTSALPGMSDLRCKRLKITRIFSYHHPGTGRTSTLISISSPPLWHTGDPPHPFERFVLCMDSPTWRQWVVFLAK